MVYDRSAKRLVLFGGYLFTNSNLARPYDTWEYDGQSKAWTHWQLSWQTNNAVLETAGTATGPWNGVTGAVSPFALEINANEAARFFRLRQP
jgi:hypothetical protein